MDDWSQQKTWNHDCGMNGSSNDISVCEHSDLKWWQGLVIRESHFAAMNSTVEKFHSRWQTSERCLVVKPATC